MSPSKFQDLDVTKGGVIYNPSSSQFRINKDSHSIQKPVIGNSSSPRSPAPKNQKRPVIIYTQPPKIHYAEVHEFMALVQRLTGLNRSEDEKAIQVQSETRDEGSFCEDLNKDFKNNIIGYEENESSSVLTDEKYYVEEYKFQNSNSAVSRMHRMPNQNQCASDVPLFSPSASEFMCSNSMFYEYPTNMGNSVSQSFMDYDMKGFPEYLDFILGDFLEFD